MHLTIMYLFQQQNNCARISIFPKPLLSYEQYTTDNSVLHESNNRYHKSYGNLGEFLKEKYELCQTSVTLKFSMHPTVTPIRHKLLGNISATRMYLAIDLSQECTWQQTCHKKSTYCYVRNLATKLPEEILPGRYHKHFMKYHSIQFTEPRSSNS